MSESSSSGGGWASAAASGGMILAPIIDTLISTNAAKKAQARQNRYNRNQSEIAFQRDIEMFDRMNEYNTPANQMKRFSEAGLNPHLIYGQGNAGNQSGTPGYTPARGEFKGIVPELSSLAMGLSNYQNFSMRQAQIDNVKAQTENINQRTSNDILLGIARQVGIDTSKFDLEQKQELEQYTQGAIQKRNTLLHQEIGMNVEKWAQEVEKTGAARQLTEQAATKTEMMKADLLFKKYENQFRQMGVQSGDHVLLRMIIRAFQNSGFDLMDLDK